jgi:TolB protein
VLFLEQVDQIISVNPRRGTTQIASINVNSGEVGTLTSVTGEKWSPQRVNEQRTAYTTLEGIEFVGGPAGARGEFWNPSWSHDGQRMVFHREMNPQWPPVREGFSPYRRVRLLRTGIFPSFTPNGERLISGSERGAILQNSILSMNLDGSDRRTIFSDARRNPVAPALSPVGDRIAFGVGTFFRGAGAQRVLPSQVQTAKAFSGLTGRRQSRFPQLVARGKTARIPICDGERQRPFDRRSRKWCDHETDLRSVQRQFSELVPAGGLITFTTNRDGDWELYVIRPDGTGLKRLTNSPGNDAHSSWSPDAKWIAFSSGRQGFKYEAALYPQNGQPYGEIHVMRADGIEVIALTDDPFEDAAPAFAPLPREAALTPFANARR